MLIKQAADIKSSEITPQSVYQERRKFIQGMGAAGLAVGAAATGNAQAGILDWFKKDKATIKHGAKLGPLVKSNYSTTEALTDYADVTSYNNFYEFGTAKTDPARNAGNFNPKPWTLSVTGECDKPGDYALEDFIAPHKLEERIYRLRCVEAWSMVIPWVGIPMAEVLKRFQPNSRAKYIEFTTLNDVKRMPGQRLPILPWPYTEGLRIDEAMNPLTLFGVGLYGEELPNQNGAPIRLIVPWKYGFKNIKSIVKIRFTETQPKNTWNVQTPKEYGFYANVNPAVNHPRWSQSRERRIGEFRKRETLIYNGYAEQVASLYQGMDLRKYI